MFETRVDSVRISKDESKDCFWVALFKNFVEFLPNIIAGQSIIWQRYIVKSRFFRGCVRLGG